MTTEPEQHGAELLTALTDILKTSSTEQDIPVSVLALRGLSKLCESEVMDLMSLWSYLGETFLNETRPLVVKELCGLLSLVPQLAVETQEYETFTKLAMMRLWAYSQSSNCLVCAAAYEALSKYSVKYFCVSYLPKSVTKDLYEQLDLAVKQMQEGKGKSDTKTDGDALDVDIMFPQILCIPPILKTILALSKSADLKPISIRLMMLLWKQQERCFPQLLQLISDSQGSSSYQVRLAVASVILEICTHK
uniref:DUF3730 domain-containing protein n=1 Tax=Biomphalaria glabrata TaxID=6526 RepID=A0A2C9M222_BIOGL